MRWNVEQRLEFIEFRLFWEGRINRNDLVTKFGISIPQASADLQKYAAFAGPNLSYDSSVKAYIASPGFQPELYRPSARRYLAYLRGIADEVFGRQETWLGWVPEFGVVPLVRRRLDPMLLRQLVQAIRAKKSLQIEYQSISRPEPTVRRISPHALGFDGFRWHTRAWCDERRDFRDFVLARILSVRNTGPSDADAVSDMAWHQYVTLKIAPHPKLTPLARRVIELDFGMQDGSVEIESRICLSFYLMRHLRLDPDMIGLEPEKQQIVLLNREEIQRTQKLFNIKQNSSGRDPESEPLNSASATG